MEYMIHALGKELAYYGVHTFSAVRSPTYWEVLRSSPESRTEELVLIRPHAHQADMCGTDCFPVELREYEKCIRSKYESCSEKTGHHACA
ncbi:hypothetical protein DPMN_120499 [Dreissena polymorpha]|uniref:Uncharacterized protein n=1 Tax=Dreissena polymorpha TaxID=45954 RepID=A0A9D4GNE5_DREPO|nr:hypothetical protein DPMN_120499 [Dreissena polymorpha]